MTGIPTVFIVDDDAAARRSVAALVNSVGLRAETFDCGEQFLASYKPEQSGCLVTDLRMLTMSGLELQEELIRRQISLPVIVITAFAETPMTVRAIQNGAVTLLEKPPRDHELIDAVRGAVAQDELNRAAIGERQVRRERLEQLTSQEREVMELMVAGKLNKVIAKELQVSTRTVESRRRSIFSKTHTASVAELVQLVLGANEE